MSLPCFGRVIWGDFLDLSGSYVKARPAVIITSDDVIPHSDKVDVVCITTKYRDSLADVQTELQPGRDTGLKEQCWAVSSWVRTIAISDIKEYAGKIRGLVMAQIIKKMDGSVPPSL